MCATGYCSSLHGIPSNNLLILEAMDDVGDDFPTKDKGDRTSLILSHACRSYHILSIINSMWTAKF